MVKAKGVERKREKKEKKGEKGKKNKREKKGKRAGISFIGNRSISTGILMGRTGVLMGRTEQRRHYFNKMSISPLHCNFHLIKK